MSSDNLIGAEVDGKKVSPVLPPGVKNILVDIDGTVGEDIPNEEPERMPGAAVFPDALAQCNRWYDEGHRLYFFTSRTLAHKQVTEEWLRKWGFKYHGIIFGKPRGGNYVWIDNHIVQGVHYEGRFTELEEATGKIMTFKNQKP